MEQPHVKRLPVVRDGRVVGIIARANLFRALAAIPPDTKRRVEDKAIRDQIWAELCKQRWECPGRQHRRKGRRCRCMGLY